jgi:uncharacterized RDD family membrane protein YckC
MKHTINKQGKAGFCVRFAAVWIDTLIVYILVKTAIALLNYCGVYVPIELTVIIALGAYSAVLLGWKGRTLGKAICGLAVCSLDESPIGYLRAFYRETICKAVSAVFFFGGFLRVAFSRNKRAWHDSLSRTVVVYSPDARRARVVPPLVLAMSALLVGPRTVQVTLACCEANRLAVEPDIINSLSQRDPSSLSDVSELEPNDRLVFAEWLNNNGLDPIEYAVQTARKHQVTIFGETHFKQEYLQFLSRLIPELYHRAGITCVAMEVCQAEDNAKLVQLVTSETFDRDIAIQIARNGPWQAWGCREYWDVLETVWRLNQSLPAEKSKMRVVGLMDYKWDGPSLGLVRSGPLWERLRVFRVLDDIALILKAGDGIYARNVEKEIIEKGEKGIVWVGASHSPTNYVFRQKYARMGFMLHHKYGSRVFQIRLHEPYCGEAIAALIERTAKGPVGFDVASSPYGPLRDDSSIYFRHQPKVCFSDMASGYIFLKAYKRLNRCDWLNGYISKDMFVRNKPFYEALCGRKLKDHREANEFMDKTAAVHNL